MQCIGPLSALTRKVDGDERLNKGKISHRCGSKECVGQTHTRAGCARLVTVLHRVAHAVDPALERPGGAAVAVLDPGTGQRARRPLGPRGCREGLVGGGPGDAGLGAGAGNAC